MTLREFKRGLKQFRKPSQEFWEHHNRGYMIRLSDGCHYLRITVSAWWLFDKIASFQSYDRIKSSSFQLWEFKLGFGDWQVKCSNAKLDILLTTKIDYARFLFDEFELVVKDGIAYLPEEYRT